MTRNEDQWQAPPALESHQYVDNRIYTDEGIFADEMEKIWSNVWKFCCHESELPNPGDFRTTIVAAKPVVLIRGDDARIRAFYNVCPHRGAEIVRTPSGNAKNFTCLFHHWTFDRAGECVSIPLPDGYEDAGVSKEGQGLRELRTESKYGFVFCNLDDDAGPLDAFLGEAFDMVAEPLGSKPLELFHFHRVVVPGNWKHWMETDREGYHTLLHVLNRNTSYKTLGYLERETKTYPGGHMIMSPQKYDFNRWEHSRRQARPETLPGIAPNHSHVVEMFPDFVINMKATVARSDSVIPVSPSETIVECRGYALADDTPELRRIRINDHNEYWGPFGNNLPEDMLACVVQMKTMRGGASPYTLWARNERGAPFFSDEPMQGFYAEWSRLLGRAANDPFNRATRRGAARGDETRAGSRATEEK